MEITHVVELPMQPADAVESVTIKQNEQETEVTPIDAVNQNHLESNNYSECDTDADPSIENVKTTEPEQALDEEIRPADMAMAPSGDNTHPAVPECSSTPHTNHSSEPAEVVTPAGTVEAPASTVDSPRPELVEKDGSAIEKKTNGADPAAVAVESEPQTTQHTVKQDTQNLEHESEQVVEHKIEEQEMNIPVSAPATSKDEEAAPASPPVTTTTEPAPEVAAASSPGKKATNEKKQPSSDSFASEEILTEVQKFLTLQIVENRCSSNTKEIQEFVEKHLNEKQRKRYVVSLVERIVQYFTQDATSKGTEVSVDVQSNICLIEHMFLTLGRRSPLQDMYTAEEEEMLDLLFHSNSSDNLPIDL